MWSLGARFTANLMEQVSFRNSCDAHGGIRAALDIRSAALFKLAVK
jgi:hypothetical protein